MPGYEQMRSDWIDIQLMKGNLRTMGELSDKFDEAYAMIVGDRVVINRIPSYTEIRTQGRRAFD